VTAVEIKFGYHGAEKLARLAAAIKDAGDKDLRRELFRAMQRSTKPLKLAAREGAIQILPYRGGLAERVATSKFSTQVRTRGKGAGVRVKGASDMDIGSMNRGRLRHLTYGHRPWRNQKVRAGWFDDSLTVEADKVRGEIVRAVDELGRKLEAKA
jgi:hypothetical protein